MFPPKNSFFLKKTSRTTHGAKMYKWAISLPRCHIPSLTTSSCLAEAQRASREWAISYWTSLWKLNHWFNSSVLNICRQQTQAGTGGCSGDPSFNLWFIWFTSDLIFTSIKSVFWITMDNLLPRVSNLFSNCHFVNNHLNPIYVNVACHIYVYIHLYNIKNWNSCVHMFYG